MKIISKYKDYYDYLQGIYGIDEILTLDRRSEEIIKPCFFEHDIKEHCFAICNNLYQVYQYKDQFYHTLEELKEMAAIVQKELNVYVYLNYYRGCFKNSTKSVTLQVTRMSESRYVSRSFIPEAWKILNQQNIKINKKYREPILYYSSIKQEWQTGAILKEFGFPKWIPAKDMFIDISNFLSYLIDNPPEPDRQTNEGKILSHGFDLKHSFRPNIKK